MPGTGTDETPHERWLTPGVLAVGGASLFSDAGHEMVTSVLPTFLTSTLHAGPGALGAIDGLADALTGVCKLAGGPLANDPTRRGRMASGGYLGTGLATAAIGLTTAVWQVGILRAVAWGSRGLRSPARDMLLTDVASEGAYGRAFGVERAGDNAGAVIGPLMAAGLVAVLGIRHAILLAFIPGVLAAVAIMVAARAARKALTSTTGRRTLSFNLGELRQAGLARVLTPVAFFELGNLATTLLILRATDLLHTDARSLTAATSLAILLYAAHNLVATLAALFGGQTPSTGSRPDRSSRQRASPTWVGTPSSQWARTRGRSCCSPSRSAEWVSGSPRPPSPRSSRAGCPPTCAATASASSASPSRSVTSAPPWSPACCGAWSRRCSRSATPPPGCSRRSSPPGCCASLRRRRTRGHEARPRAARSGSPG